MTTDEMSSGRERQPADPQAILRAAEAAVRARAGAPEPSPPAPPGAGVDGSGWPSVDAGAGRREGSVASLGTDVPEDVRKAVAFILRSTGQRAQTEAELRTKLARREVDEPVIDAALRHARALRAVDDAAFARSWVNDRGVGRGFGATRLRAELRKRQLPDALIEQALATLEERDDHEAATALARKRVQQLPSSLPAEAVVRRLTSYLVRRGHPPGLAQRVAISVSGIDRDWD